MNLCHPSHGNAGAGAATPSKPRGGPSATVGPRLPRVSFDLLLAVRWSFALLELLAAHLNIGLGVAHFVCHWIVEEPSDQEVAFISKPKSGAPLAENKMNCRRRVQTATVPPVRPTDRPRWV